MIEEQRGSASEQVRESMGTPTPPPVPSTPSVFLMTRYFMASLDDPVSWRDWKESEGYMDLGVTGLGQRTYPRRFVAALKGEGCAKVPEGVLTFDGASYALVDPVRFPWGLNAIGGPLIPFRSIAVDRHVIKMGTTVMVPALKGLSLPTGDRHDGLVRATDTGGRIKGTHFDWFVGTRAWCDALAHLPDQVSVIFPA